MATMPTIPSNSVQCVVTSPPYFALRSYLPAGHPDKAKEIGSEPTPEAFIRTMVDVFREVRRVLREDGVCFINLGDSYASSGGSFDAGSSDGATGRGPRGKRQPDNSGNILNIPHRVAEALRQDGWNWRQTIVWAKRCLSGGTWLYARTAKGDAPAMLKDLVRLDPATVKLWDGTKWTQVIGWSKTEPAKGSRRKVDRSGCLELVLKSGERIGCTAEHRWPTTEGEKTTDQLRPGDVLLSARLPEPEVSKPMCLNDQDFGWLCGFYLAEGFKTDKGVTFSIHQNETAEVDRIRRMAELMGGTASFQKNKGNGAVVVVYSTALRQLLDEFVSGTDCRNKRLDRKAWMRPNTFIASLLQGYLDGDGHKRPDTNEWRVGFCNNDGLATDLRAICARLGVSIRLKRAKHKCGDRSFPGWRGSIRLNNDRREPDTMIAAIECSRARTFWDIEVADKPNWFCLASGVISHNSPMPESVRGWAWRRCRVKIGRSAANPGTNGTIGIEGNGRTHGMDARFLASFQPCPGCPKCIPNDGWILQRGKGRCTTAHEYIFVMTKGERYFWDSEGSREAQSSGTVERFKNNNSLHTGWNGKGLDAEQGTNLANANYKQHLQAGLIGGRNPRSYWLLSSEPTREKHFAAFPSELVRRCLVAGCSAGGCCAECGQPFAPMVESERVATRPGDNHKETLYGKSEANTDAQRHIAISRTLGYRATCSCPPAAPGRQIVFDPFSGTGTVAQTARQLGHDYLGCELNPAYIAISDKRIQEPPRWFIRQQNANKPKRPKPVIVAPGQLSLFGSMEESA